MKSALLYPFKFKPILKDQLWGGTKLETILGKSIPNNYTGESWEVSGVKGNVSIVANGPLSGTSIQQLIDQYPIAMLGRETFRRYGNEFPILVKFIDANKDLSIQLHPGDELARARHDSFGKTEMWYIMNADQGAELIIGFNKDVTPEEYKSSLESHRLTDLMNYVSVKEGDAFFINSGRVHAIGAGVMLAEIQQTSDITYRLYDFNRRDQNGNLRELHTEMALDAIDYSKKDDFILEYESEHNVSNEMVDSPYFATNYLKLTEDMDIDLGSRDSFTIYICVKGSAQFETSTAIESLNMGETILIPACADGLKIRTKDATAPPAS